jgi:hypothetical protein
MTSYILNRTQNNVKKIISTPIKYNQHVNISHFRNIQRKPKKVLVFKTRGCLGNTAFYPQPIFAPRRANGWDFHAPEISRYLSVERFYCIPAPEEPTAGTARVWYDVERCMLRPEVMQYPARLPQFSDGLWIVGLIRVIQIINATLVK